MTGKCPDCQEELEVGVKSCPHCKKIIFWQEEKPETLEERARRKSGCLLFSPGLYAPLLLIIVIIILGLIFVVRDI